jgi:hypothetical protein
LNERIKSEFAEAYLGGDEEDYDVVKDMNEDQGIVDGIEVDDDGDGTIDRSLGRDIFNEIRNIAYNVGSSPDDANYARIVSEKLLDLEGFIDYMLINFYI